MRKQSCQPRFDALEDRSVPSSFATIMSGLDSPRGLAFGPDGLLYVAEAGHGDSDGLPYTVRPNAVSRYGEHGAVTRLANGIQERIVSGLPSLGAPNGTQGPQDIAFDASGNAFVTIGFGSDPRRRTNPVIDNPTNLTGGLGELGAQFDQLVKLQPGGIWQNVADIGNHEAVNNPAGGPYDSNAFGLLAVDDGFVVADAGGNDLLHIATDGTISTLAVLPAIINPTTGAAIDSVPTSVVVGPDGAYYIGTLTGNPFLVGAASVYRVVPGQAPTIYATGFTQIIDLDFGPDGSLCVLQHAAGGGFTTPGSLIHIAPDGTRSSVEIPGLTLTRPTSVLVDHDGAIYVSNNGVASTVGTGEVIRITLGPAKVDSVVVNDGSAQRSMVNSLTVTFDRTVTLSADAFQLQKQGGGLVNLNVSTSVYEGKTVVVVTFAGSGIVGGSLADGTYTLSIRSDRVTDGDGTALDGNGDGSAGGDHTNAFHRLFGDGDRDRDVDLRDLGLFLGTIGRHKGQSGYLWYFDVNGDDRVALFDTLAFTIRLGTHLNL